jgi:hypothetical protein
MQISDFAGADNCYCRYRYLTLLEQITAIASAGKCGAVPGSRLPLKQKAPSLNGREGVYA